MSTAKGIAVVTGASSGIGAVYADRLARQGYDLIIVARSAEKLEAVAARVRKETGRVVETFNADLTQRKDVKRVEALLAGDARITLLVNNAGVGASAQLLDTDVDKMSEMIALNVEALTRLTYAVVPAMVARKRGTIINVGSVVGITPEVLNGVYGGTKAFVMAFSQSLRKELTPLGITVQLVMPGATATNFWDVFGTPLTELPAEMVMSVDDLVDAALAGLSQGEFATIPSLPDVQQWEAYDNAREAMNGNLSLSSPAARYGVKSRRPALQTAA